MEDGPGSGCGRGVLASHEEGDHDVSDLLVGEGLASLVFLVLQRGEHVEVGLPERGQLRVPRIRWERRTASADSRRRLRMER